MGTLLSSGTQTATISTEHTLATITAVGVSVVLKVDVGAMTSGDTVIVRARERVLAGGTQRLAYETTLTGDQTTDACNSVPIVVGGELALSLTQTAGTGRAYPYAVIRLDT